jgi:hypothetical protein
MLRHDIDGSALEALANEYAATPRQMEMAQGRAAKRTAATIRRLASTGLRTELGLRNATALRRRLKEFKVGRSGKVLKVWIGANDLPISAFKGRLQKVPGGIRLGSTTIHGAFFMRVGGKRRVYQRIDGQRDRISEVSMPVADRMMVYLEDEVFTDVGSIFMRHLVSEVRARTMLDAARS